MTRPHKMRQTTDGKWCCQLCLVVLDGLTDRDVRMLNESGDCWGFDRIEHEIELMNRNGDAPDPDVVEIGRLRLLHHGPEAFE